MIKLSSHLMRIKVYNHKNEPGPQIYNIIRKVYNIMLQFNLIRQHCTLDIIYSTKIRNFIFKI